jgi:DNA-binding transcriptional MerR regulator
MPKIISDAENIRRTTLLMEPYSYDEVGKLLNVSEDVIRVFRYTRGIPAKMMNRGHYLSDEDNIERTTLLMENISYRKIGKLLDINPATLSYFKNQRGIPHPKLEGGQEISDKENILRTSLLVDGFTYSKVSKITKKTIGGLAGYVRRTGIPRPKRERKICREFAELAQKDPESLFNNPRLVANIMGYACPNLFKKGKEVEE